MIVYFSGTGNSRAVASMLGEILDKPVVNMMDVDSVIPTGKDIIWVFPVHSWGMPMKVRERIREIKVETSGNIHHMIATCGDDCGLTDRMWRKEMTDKGWTPGGAYTVEMPNTYVALPFFDVDPPEMIDRKLSGMRPRLEEIAYDIQTGKLRTDVIRGAMPKVKTDLIYPFFMRHLVNPDRFWVDAGKCIACGKCMRSCPLGNVKKSPEGLPVWQDDCCMCLACYHHCPHHAISYGHSTKGKGQYYFGISDRKQ